jgi:hypothetical protein
VSDSIIYNKVRSGRWARAAQADPGGSRKQTVIVITKASYNLKGTRRCDPGKKV